MPNFIYNNSTCYYEEKGNGIPLIFLHGNTASSKMFSEISDKYSQFFKVILIDFLGHGNSQRLEKFPSDLWFDEAKQVIEFIKQKNYEKVYLIGSSGGALVALNVALEAPNMVLKVIADSFEGEEPLKDFTQNVVNEREASKHDEGAKMFYEYMHGSDWESVVDNDTNAIFEHAQKIGKFFHKPLKDLKAEILMTGSKEDEFISIINKNFYEETYGKMIEKIGHGEYFLFEKGGHPAMLSNKDEFFDLSLNFLN